jgi:hypothetical protein
MPETKTEAALVRMTRAQKEKFLELAEREGRSLGGWFRELGRREVVGASERRQTPRSEEANNTEAPASAN